ncbi:MAG: hypothetical protein ACM3U1_04475 [Chloroflexota bacterium]
MPILVFPPNCSGITWSAIGGELSGNAALWRALNAPREAAREITFQKRGSVSADPAPGGAFLPIIITSACRAEGVFSRLESGSAVCSVYLNGAPAPIFQNFPVSTQISSIEGELELSAGDLLGVKVETISNDPAELNISIKIISLAGAAL